MIFALEILSIWSLPFDAVSLQYQAECQDEDLSRKHFQFSVLMQPTYLPRYLPTYLGTYLPT